MTLIRQLAEGKQQKELGYTSTPPTRPHGMKREYHALSHACNTNFHKPNSNRPPDIVIKPKAKDEWSPRQNLQHPPPPPPPKHLRQRSRGQLKCDGTRAETRFRPSRETDESI